MVIQLTLAARSLVGGVAVGTHQAQHIAGRTVPFLHAPTGMEKGFFAVGHLPFAAIGQQCQQTVAFRAIGHLRQQFRRPAPVLHQLP